MVGEKTCNMILDILENSNYYRNPGYYVSDEVYKKFKKYIWNEVAA